MRFGLREFVFILLLLAVPVLSYFFVFEPRNEQIDEARQEIRKKQAKLRELEDATASFDDLGAEIDRLQEAVEVFEQKLPAQREVEKILESIWNLANENALMPDSVRTDKPVMSAAYAEQPIKIKISGEFDGFYKFMLALERMQRITRLPKMKLTKPDRDLDAPMEAELVMSIFFEPQGSGSSAARGRRPS